MFFRLSLPFPPSCSLSTAIAGRPLVTRVAARPVVTRQLNQVVASAVAEKAGSSTQRLTSVHTDVAKANQKPTCIITGASSGRCYSLCTM